MGGWQDFTQKVVPFLASDLLLEDTTTRLNVSGVFTPTLEDGYGGVLITTVQPTLATLTVTVTDQAGLIPQWTARRLCQPNIAVSFMPPYPYVPPSSLVVQITSSVAQAAAGTTWILGMSGGAPGLQGAALIRPDGRPYPTGQAGVTIGAGAVATDTVIAAPGFGLHILLKLLAIQGGATTAGVSNAGVEGTIGGVATVLLASSGGTGLGGPNQLVSESGILLDANTALTFVVSTASAQGWLVSAVYDIVP